MSGRVGSTKEKRAPRFVFIDGDVMIGGLSPVHFSPIDESGLDPDAFACQGEFNTRGFEAVEAMLFTMDMLNQGTLKDVVLPNITIGMDIKETCTTADNAVRESLKFSFIRNANMHEKCSGSNQVKTRETKTVAVVGAAYSGVSMAVTNLCGLFYVPLVSYASTSRLLSNKVQFRYFFRTVPSDMLQAQVMADLVKTMNWNYVITLASDTEYGRSGIEAFKNAAQRLHDYHICIPVDETFTKRSDKKTFDKIFQKMRMYPKAKVVILFAELHDAQILIDKIRERGIKEKYIWIGSDAWADSKQILKANEAILNGMFAIVPEVRKIDKFVQYFVNFDDKRRQRNPWTREYEDVKVAHDPAFHRQTFNHYPKAAYVMDAVLATAYALHDVLGCKPYTSCSPMKYKLSSPHFQKDFVAYLEKVRFPAMSRNYMNFDDSGDAIGIYDIKHLKLIGDNYEFFKIGKWGSRECDFKSASGSAPWNCLELQKLLLEQSVIKPNLSENDIPFSRCSPTCSAGYHKVTEKDYAKCCWTCRKCTRNYVTNTTDSDECWRCPRGFWPNSLNSKCEPIDPTFLKWVDPPALIICISIGFGMLAVFGAFFVFFFYRDTPVVKASSRELCYALLLGIFWCYVTPIFYILEPTDTVCRFTPFATGLCPSLVVGTLLTKTNRISRIFNRKLNHAGAPACLSKKWQVLMVVCIALIEITICGIYTFSSDTGRIVVTFESRNEVIIECKSMPDIWVAIWWAYVVGLVVTCTYQAFLTRKLPENYNEAKFITFTMLITCIVVIMFIPTYIGTSGVYRTVISCFVFIIGGSAAFGCIFVPKLYIILWRPEKNIPMQPRSHSIRLGTISPSFSLVRRLSIDDGANSSPDELTRIRVHSAPPVRYETEMEREQMRRRVGSSRRSASLSINAFRRDVNIYQIETTSRTLSSGINIEENIVEDNENLSDDVRLSSKRRNGDACPHCGSTEKGRSNNEYVKIAETTDLEDAEKRISDDKHKGEIANGDLFSPQLSKSWSNLRPACIAIQLPTTCTSETNLSKTFTTNSQCESVRDRAQSLENQLRDCRCICEENDHNESNQGIPQPLDAPVKDAISERENTKEEELLPLWQKRNYSRKGFPKPKPKIQYVTNKDTDSNSNKIKCPLDEIVKKKLPSVEGVFLNGLSKNISSRTDALLGNVQRRHECNGDDATLFNGCNHLYGNDALRSQDVMRTLQNGTGIDH
ncbi:hypothetical protein QZH41_005102 [Actinostola sp. cb2023]|nr:hypothetical protein QZH41_005102 [Actinostola sp. cb2023]